ncbi:MAG: Cobyrinic acid A,C-diamide synthase [Firmicutes bacterium]|nr:Cobyrinic acid A,C-diamide synthase [Bacillota bacterium]
MTLSNIPRLVIAGTGSGVGKTTIVTGLLAALKERGLKVRAYKVGPDYIDPGYHRLASGQASHNLDTWLVPQDRLAGLFVKTASDCDLVVIEGVMGLYDGGRGGISSTAAIAKELAAPVVLVLDAKAAGESVGATALGFKMYDPAVQIAGVIVNRLGSDSHKVMVDSALERLDITAFGYIRRSQTLTVKERHLGLTPVDEIQAEAAVRAMVEAVQNYLDIDRLVETARSAPPLEVQEVMQMNQPKTVRIGVARDEAFSFYYPESLAVLEELGAEIVPFSPLKDKRLPVVDGLILGGGFPEMFLTELEENQVFKAEICGAACQGMPIYAECGGMMYLSRYIEGFDGKRFSMVGLIPAGCRMQDSLHTVGYVEAVAREENIFCQAGEALRGHEFHFSHMLSDDNGKFPWAFQFHKLRTGQTYPGGYANGNVLASYLHLHFAGNLPAAGRFLQKCKEFQQGRGYIWRGK